jgi:hypothetical protein
VCSVSPPYDRHFYSCHSDGVCICKKITVFFLAKGSDFILLKRLKIRSHIASSAVAPLD